MVLRQSLLRCFSTWRSPCSGPAKQADLGRLIDTIHSTTPDLLRHCYPDDIIHRDISLHVFPESQIHLPTVTGKHAYRTSLKLVQFLVTTLLVPSSSDLAILSSRLDYPTSSTTHRPIFSNKQTKISAGAPELKSEIPPRLIMRWRTISPSGISDDQTFMTHSWSSSLSKINPVHFGIHPQEHPVLTGIFEFDFAGDCSAVISHTITDVEYISSMEEEPVPKPVGT